MSEISDVILGVALVTLMTIFTLAAGGAILHDEYDRVTAFGVMALAFGKYIELLRKNDEKS